MIFSEKDMNKNWLYSPVMGEINKLHDEHGRPEMEVRGPTTEAAGYDATYGIVWQADSIGDWGGQEEEIASWAQQCLEDVLEAIDRGKYRYYNNQGCAWEGFADQAKSVVDEFNASGDAYNLLCDEWGEHEKN